MFTGEVLNNRATRRLTAERSAELREVLSQVCSLAGLDSTGAKFIRFSVNGVFLLESEPVVVRLRRGERRVVERTVASARWLADRRVPAIRLYADFEQPLELGEYTATFWLAVQHMRQRLRGGDLAKPLRELHKLSPMPHLPEWNPFNKIRRRISSEAISGEDRAWLEDECATLERALQVVIPTLPYGPIHSDANTSNIVRGPSGEVVLCDLDSMTNGPLLYDLVPTAVDGARFGRAVDHATLAYAYGLDVTRESTWPLFRRLYELGITVAGFAKAEGRPAVLAEARHRLHTLQTGDMMARWRRYSSVSPDASQA